MTDRESHNDTVYIVDANFLINFHKWMPRSLFPAFWQELEQTLQEGRWVLLDVVVSEVTREGPMKRWCKKQEQAGLVAKVTDTDKLAGAEINNQYPMIDANSGRSTNDTYIIAHAKANGYGVASAEVPRINDSKPYKIPDVCEELKIPRIRKAEVLYKRLGIDFINHTPT
jgi:predicted nucleic acid-binding protein